MAKHRTGHLFKRGSNFYVRWVIEGKVFSKALRTPTGERISNRREAEDAKAKAMAAFLVADEVTALESISAKLQGRRAELERLNLEQNPPTLVADAWGEYVDCPNRPDSGEGTLRQYEFQWKAFSRWIAEHRSDVRLSRR